MFVLANGKPLGSLGVLNEAGETAASLSLDSVADGPLTLRAYAAQGQNHTLLSDAVATIKDTRGPVLASESLSFILSPASDRPSALLATTDTSVTRMHITQNDEDLSVDTAKPTVIGTTAPLTIAAVNAAGTSGTPHTVSLAAQFDRDDNAAYTATPARFSRNARTLFAIVVLVITVLLGLAVFIRIRVQHPTMIAHSAGVIFLALLLFLW